MKLPLACLALLLGASSAPARASARAAPTAGGRDLKSKKKHKKSKKSKKGGGRPPGRFNRISTFAACQLIDPTCDTDEEAVSEIVAATSDGTTLVYTDSAREKLGIVDIADPSNPRGAGAVDLPGEPTSVAIRTRDDLAFVAVNTSPNFVEPSGVLLVYDLADTGSGPLAEFDVGGQPDSVDVSPDGRYVAVAVENERDEDLGDGGLPQMPPGYLYVLDASDADPSDWEGSVVDLTGLPGVAFPSDPEPEFVDVNEDNICAITLQENNAVVLVDLETLTVINSFSAGTVDLTDIDVEDNSLVDQSQTLTDVPREPDGAAWIGTSLIATADEGDLEGGGRGFTVFNAGTGGVVYTSGNDLEHETARLGQYQEGRSDNKGAEHEHLTVGRGYGGYGDGNNGDDFLFVNAERAGLTFVYSLDESELLDMSEEKKSGKSSYKSRSDKSDKNSKSSKSKSKSKKGNEGLRYVQALPTLLGPEGTEAIPHRNLLVVASEDDDRGDKFRAGLTIYEFQPGEDASYPTLISKDRKGAGPGVPIPWGAMSGLSSCPSGKESRLWAVEDSFFRKSRFFEISTKKHPAIIKKEVRLRDDHGTLASVPPYGEFSAEDLQALINEDGTVNLDLEGISACANGKKGFWIVSEGRGTVGDGRRPVESLNFLLRVDKKGVIEEVVTLPDAVNDVQVRYGFEGVASPEDDDRFVVVAFQRAWGDEPHPRLGIYDTHTKNWKFVFYPLDPPESQNGGWVGLSDLSPLGGGRFLVLERDNQGGFDAAIKRIYEIDLGNLEDVGDMSPSQTVTKTLVRDILPDLREPNGLPYEKVEGMAVTKTGEVWIVNDNDGVDDNSGETQLLNLGNIMESH